MRCFTLGSDDEAKPFQAVLPKKSVAKKAAKKVIEAIVGEETE